jgi:hypothetical protein
MTPGLANGISHVAFAEDDRGQNPFCAPVPVSVSMRSSRLRDSDKGACLTL